MIGDRSPFNLVGGLERGLGREQWNDYRAGTDIRRYGERNTLYQIRMADTCTAMLIVGKMVGLSWYRTAENVGITT